MYGAGENAVPASIGDAEIDARAHRLPPTGAQLGSLVDDELVARMVRSAKAVSPVLDVDNGAKLVKADVSVSSALTTAVFPPCDRGQDAPHWEVGGRRVHQHRAWSMVGMMLSN